MAWPKGKPRKGHVKADGTLHAVKGSKLKPAPVVVADGEHVYRESWKRHCTLCAVRFA